MSPLKGSGRAGLLELGESYLATILLYPLAGRIVLDSQHLQWTRPGKPFPGESRGPHQEPIPLACTNPASGGQTVSQACRPVCICTCSSVRQEFGLGLSHDLHKSSPVFPLAST